MDFYLQYKDNKYKIKNSKSTISDALFFYYQIKTSSKQELTENENELYETALNCAKLTTMTGVNENYNHHN